MNRLLCVLLVAAFAWLSPPPVGAQVRQTTAHGTSFIHTQGNEFVNSEGQPIRFQGVNVVDKSTGKTNISIGPQDFAAIHSWGMNAIRLCISWNRLEPQPGQLNTQYLNKVANWVQDAQAHGLYVLLDMHQDLYSVKFGDGAPLWATLDDGKPHAKVTDWNDAYFVSPDVQAALDHFWANSKAPDGVGLQEHYARVWQFVAERFKNNPNVIGYDLMNEPFPGTDAGRLEYVMLARLSQLLATRPGQPHPTTDELMQMEGTAKGGRQITQWLGNIALYRSMLDAGQPVAQHFDQHSLMPFYNRVARAIRSVDQRHIIFIEPDMSANMGVKTGITPLTDANGKRDPEQAFSPHVYDIVVDTNLFDLYSNARINLILSRDQHFAQQHQMPVLVGEWGAFYGNPAAANAAAQMKKKFAALGFSDLYWSYGRNLKNWKGLAALKVKTSNAH